MQYFNILPFSKSDIEVMQVTSQALVRWRLGHFGRNESYCVIPFLSYHLFSYHATINSIAFRFNFKKLPYRSILTGL